MTHPAARPATRRPDRMLARERAALALLALSGAAFLPGALNRFVFPKLALVAAATALAATVPARGRLPRAAVALLLGGAGVLVLAALSGRAPLLQLIGLPPRYEGLVALPLYVGAGVSGARLLGHGRARGSSRWFLDWLAVAALAIATEALLETLGLRPLTSNVSRPGSLLGNASDEGAWAVLALGPLLAAAVRVRGRLFTAGALGAALTVVCSASRGALLGALVTVLLLVLITRSRQTRVAFGVAATALAIGAIALPTTRGRLIAGSGEAAHTVTGRLLLWRETLQLLANHPLLGVGPSGYLNAVPRYHTVAYERQIGPQNPPDSPHNWLLQAAVAGGIPLLLMALALAALTLSRGWRALSQQEAGGEAAVLGGLLAGLSGYGVALMFTPTSPGVTPLAALFGGALLAGLPAHAHADRAAAAWARVRGAARLTAVGAFVALTVVMACAAAAEVALRAAIDDAASGRLPASQRAFTLARELRPWDIGVIATAAHAYVTLSGYGIATAIPYARHWSQIELQRWPGDVQVLSDAATLANAEGDHRQALVLVRRALALEPNNPDLAQLRAHTRASIHHRAARTATTARGSNPV